MLVLLVRGYYPTVMILSPGSSAPFLDRLCAAGGSGALGSACEISVFRPEWCLMPSIHEAFRRRWLVR